MITPLDIKQQTFGRALRGYDVEEVKAFLNNLSREWEGVLDENRKLVAELERVKDKLRTYKDMEAALHRTLQQAEQTAASTSEAAKREAEILLRETRQKAQDLIESARRKQEEAERETRELIYRRDGVAAELKTFLNAQLERLKIYEGRISALETPLQEATHVHPAPATPPAVAGPETPMTETSKTETRPVQIHNEPAAYGVGKQAQSFVPHSPTPAVSTPQLPEKKNESLQSDAAETPAPLRERSFFESALSAPPTPDFLDEL
jgi:DivIVA domain-containing protein